MFERPLQSLKPQTAKQTVSEFVNVQQVRLRESKISVVILENGLNVFSDVYQHDRPPDHSTAPQLNSTRALWIQVRDYQDGKSHSYGQIWSRGVHQLEENSEFILTFISQLVFTSDPQRCWPPPVDICGHPEIR